jgi:hypothetical protein
MLPTQASALVCVSIIRKWLDAKETKKFRQAENQKQKRKMKKDFNDIEAFEVKFLALNEVLKGGTKDNDVRIPKSVSCAVQGTAYCFDPPVYTTPVDDLNTCTVEPRK